MDSAGREPVTIDLSSPGAEATLKDNPFKIKEGSKFTMTAKFKVQHEILSGLHYVQVVKRKGIKVSKDSEMIVRSLWGEQIATLVGEKEIANNTSGNREATHQTPTSSLPTPRSVSCGCHPHYVSEITY